MQRWITRVLLWAPAAAAGAFLLGLLAHQGQIRAALNSHADFASAPVLAELARQAPPGSEVVLGDYRWYEAFWLLRATAWLPSHFFVWQLVPFVLWAAAVLCVGCSVWRAADSRWAGITAAALVICGGVGMRGALWSLNTHGPAAVHVALLGAWMVVVLATPRWAAGIRGWGAALAVGLITAVGATDPLVLLLGVGPLLLAGVLVWFWRREPELLRLGALVSAVAVLGAALLERFAVDANFTWTERAVRFVAPERVVEQLGLLPGMLGRLSSVLPFGRELELGSAIAMAVTFVALVAVVVVLQQVVRQVKRTVWVERFTAVGATARASAAPGKPGHDGGPAARAATDRRDAVFVATLTFWGAVLALNLLAVVFTTAVIDAFGSRYLVSGWVAVAVLIPLVAVRLQLRWLAGLAATVLCVGSTYAFLDEPSPTFEGVYPTETFAQQVEQFAKANGADYGYAGFWDALPLTWHTRFGIQAYPVTACNVKNCRFYQHNVSSWYQPKPGRSFLVIDPSQPRQPIVDPAYGAPVASARIGPATVFVYDHDIAGEIEELGQ